MAERDLLRLERVGDLRRTARERRLAETRRLLDAADTRRAAAELRHLAQVAIEHEMSAQCYASPADPQGWIACQRRTGLVAQAGREATARRSEADALTARKSIEAKALLRDETKLAAIRQRLAAARRAAKARKEESMAEDFCTRPVRRSRA